MLNSSPVDVRFTSAGEVTVRLSDMSNTSSANRAIEKVLTFYVVRLNRDISEVSTYP